MSGAPAMCGTCHGRGEGANAESGFAWSDLWDAFFPVLQSVTIMAVGVVRLLYVPIVRVGPAAAI